MEIRYEFKRCADIVDVRDGTHDSPKYVLNGYPLVTSKNIKNGKLDFENINYICSEDFEKINKRSKVDKGDIIMPMIGTVGNPLLVETDEEFAIKNVALFKFQDNEIIFNRFFYYFLLSDLCKKQLSGSKRGGTQSFVSLKDLRNLKVPLPAFEQQKNIVTVLDKVQALIEKRKAGITKLNELIQAVFLDMFGDPVTNPNKYLTQPVKEICRDILGGGTPSKSRPEYYVGDIPWVTPKDMKKLLIKDSIDHINNDAIENSSAKLIPKNSLIMVIRSGILKKKLPLAINQREITINQDMKAFVLNNEKVKVEYLLFFFNFYQKVLLSKVRSVTADNIEFKQIKELMVPLPSIVEQQKFVDLFNKVLVQQEKEKHNLNKLEIGFQSLMQQAFKSELKVNIEIKA